MADEPNALAAVQAAQADPVTEPAKPTQVKDPDTGKFVSPTGQGDEGKEKGDHFKNARRELREAQKAIKERDERNMRTEERMNLLLDIVERRTAKESPKTDPLSHLAADDPDRPLFERKLKPFVDSALTGTARELAEVKAALKELQDERAAAKGQRDQLSVFQSNLRDFVEDRDLSPAAMEAIRSVIEEGRVGGNSYEDAFDNALVYLKGAGKMPAPGKGKGKESGDERTSVGGVMPGQAGAPVSSDDYKLLRKSFAEAKAEGDGEAENRAFQLLLAKAREEQGR